MSAPRALPVFEFPEWLGAITVRELRAGLVARDLVFLLIITQLGLAFAGIFAVQLATMVPREAANLLRGVVITAWVLGLFVHAPIRALRALHADRDSGLLALLQITPQSSARIVFGKWLSGALQSALFLVTLLPFLVLRFFIGGADPLGEGATLLAVFMISLTVQAFCLLASTLHRAIRALALLGLLIAALGFGVNFAVSGIMGGGAAAVDYTWVAYVVVGCSVLTAMLLSAAAQTIASPAENYVSHFRLLVALAIALTIAVTFDWGIWGFGGLVGTSPREVVLVLFGCGLAAAAFFEFSAQTEFVPKQVPRWLRRIPGGGFWLSLLLPGWRSAVCFYPLAFLVLFGALLFGNHRLMALVLFAQGMAALLVPRVVLELARLRSRGSGVPMMLLLQAIVALVGLSIVAACSLSRTEPSWPQYLPGVGFWTGLAWAENGWDVLWPLIWTAVQVGYLAWVGRHEHARARRVLATPVAAAK